MADIQVELHDGPLRPAGAAVLPPGAGGYLCFEGWVRPQEGGRSLAGLEYSAYEPMAQKQLVRLAEGLVAAHGLLAVRIAHSRGFVPVGQCSFRAEIWSRHRKEALAAMDALVDQLKADVPIWKSPRWPA